jgi:hypothetical protein
MFWLLQKKKEYVLVKKKSHLLELHFFSKINTKKPQLKIGKG